MVSVLYDTNRRYFMEAAMYDKLELQRLIYIVLFPTVIDSEDRYFSANVR